MSKYYVLPGRKRWWRVQAAISSQAGSCLVLHTRRRPNVGNILGPRQRRGPRMFPTLGRRLVTVGQTSSAMASSLGKWSPHSPGTIISRTARGSGVYTPTRYRVCSILQWFKASLFTIKKNNYGQSRTSHAGTTFLVLDSPSAGRIIAGALTSQLNTLWGVLLVD